MKRWDLSDDAKQARVASLALPTLCDDERLSVMAESSEALSVVRSSSLYCPTADRVVAPPLVTIDAPNLVVADGMWYTLPASALSSRATSE
jgi:hypothetical protein